MRLSQMIPLALSAAFLANPVLAEGDVPPGTVYVCDPGSKTLPHVQVVLPTQPDGPATLMLESEALEMAPVPVASGFGYDIVLPVGHFLVRGKGKDVTLLVGDAEPKPCVLQTAFDPTENLSRAKTLSLGGNVRIGPGIDFARSDGVPYGEPVVIVSATGVLFDGYEWFEIEYAEGLRGFHWGGIICATNAAIPGLYEDCPADLR